MQEILIENCPHIQDISGPNEKNIRRIEKRFGVELLIRGETVRVRGDEKQAANVGKLIEELSGFVESGGSLENGAIKFIIHAFYDDPQIKIAEVFGESVRLKTDKREVMARSVGQKEYIFAMNHFDVVIAIGPAGTGKTYLATAAAVNALLEKRVSRIILTRPAVEAGEKLGFLPGDLAEKIDPYLRPLNDALFDMLGPEKTADLMAKGEIEIAPLAYMRGRTLSDAFIILDEAQNSTPQQMKMFLTRFGNNSKVVVTGDITQIDLENPRSSGLIAARHILRGVEGIRFISFTGKDVVRNELVRKILKAYDIHENEKKEGS